MSNTADSNSGHNFGTFTGVFLPSILTIFGLIMFMRLGYVIGNAGILGALIILLIAKSITFSTGLSISSISSNTPVSEGGAYFLISRSLGSGFGGAIGIALFLAQAISIPFYILGFTEALIYIFPWFAQYYLEVGLAVAILLFIISWSGAQWAIKTQIAIFVILTASIIVFLAGSALDFKIATFHNNLMEIPTARLSTIFAIFFPAVTGVMAGVNMSGDLKDPGKSLPRGTLIAIIVATIVYGAQILITGGAFDRGTLINDPFTSLVDNAIFGLGFIVIIGVFSAVLSSALGSMLGAPRVLRALAKDSILPGLETFKVGRGKHNEPHRALLLSMIITVLIITWAGIQKSETSGVDPLNVVAEIVTMFFLYTYGMINLAAFVESFGANPSFRPKFKYFHWSFALFGFIACLIVSFLISFWTALISLLLIWGLFYLSRTRSLEQKFGDARRGFVYSQIRSNLLKLSSIPPHPKNWRPNITVFTGNPQNRLALLGFAVRLEGRRGIISLVEFITGSFAELKEKRSEQLNNITSFLNENELDVFPEVVITPDFDSGVSIFLQGHSIGPIKPNIIMMGFPTNKERLTAFTEHLKMIIGLNMSFIIYADPEKRGIPNHPQGHYIDIWWRGHQNGSLMLIMAYILQMDPAWSNIEIRIIRMVESKSAIKYAENDINEIIVASRINAQHKILVSSNFTESFQNTSRDSALIFLGTRRPINENTKNFFLNLETLIGDMPPTFLVNSCGSADLLE